MPIRFIPKVAANVRVYSHAFLRIFLGALFVFIVTISVHLFSVDLIQSLDYKVLDFFINLQTILYLTFYKKYRTINSLVKTK